MLSNGIQLVPVTLYGILISRIFHVGLTFRYNLNTQFNEQPSPFICHCDLMVVLLPPLFFGLAALDSSVRIILCFCIYCTIVIIIKDWLIEKIRHNKTPAGGKQNSCLVDRMIDCMFAWLHWDFNQRSPISWISELFIHSFSFRTFL